MSALLVGGVTSPGLVRRRRRGLPDCRNGRRQGQPRRGAALCSVDLPCPAAGGGGGRPFVGGRLALRGGHSLIQERQMTFVFERGDARAQNRQNKTSSLLVPQNSKNVEPPLKDHRDA